MKHQLLLLLSFLISSLIYSQTEYIAKYDNGQTKFQGFLIDSVLIGKYTEYYKNGFLKIESEIIDLDKDGIYREFYENGNKKYEGFFKNDNPIDKQYFYNLKGEITKIETWKDGKLIETEIKK